MRMLYANAFISTWTIQGGPKIAQFLYTLTSSNIDHTFFTVGNLALRLSDTSPTVLFSYFRMTRYITDVACTSTVTVPFRW